MDGEYIERSVIRVLFLDFVSPSLYLFILINSRLNDCLVILYLVLCQVCRLEIFQQFLVIFIPI